MTQKLRLRTAPYYWTRASVDRKNLRLYDVVAMQANVEALGHGCMTDLKSVQMVEQLTRNHRGGLGVQGRFGHPGMSENAAGRKVMLSKNFRIANGKLLHEVHLLEEARKSPVFSNDPIEYILDVAESQPGELAESLVVDVDLVWTFADGTEFDRYDRDGMREAGHRLDEDGQPIDALTSLPVMRPVTLYYLDLVNEGALTHEGLFSSDVAQAMFLGTSSAYADQLFGFIDQFREQYNIPLDALPGKVERLLGTYIDSRGNEMATKRTARKPAPARLKMDAAESGVVPADELLDEDEDTTEVEPVEPADDVDLDAIEAESEATAAASAGDDGDTPEPSAAPESLSIDPQRFAALEQDLAQLKRIVKLQSSTIRNLTEQVNEPHVRLNVPRAATKKTLSAQGVPPATLTNQRPDLLVNRRVQDNGAQRPQDEAGMAVLAANQRRAANS